MCFAEKWNIFFTELKVWIFIGNDKEKILFFRKIKHIILITTECIIILFECVIFSVYFTLILSPVINTII